MAEEINTNLGDLNAVLEDNKETIKTLTKQIENQSGSQQETIFATSPTSPSKPPNFVFFILIGVILFLFFGRKLT